MGKGVGAKAVPIYNMLIIMELSEIYKQKVFIFMTCLYWHVKNMNMVKHDEHGLQRPRP